MKAENVTGNGFKFSSTLISPSTRRSLSGMILGLPARVRRALETAGLGHWMMPVAEFTVGRRAVYVVFESPDGKEHPIEFDIEPARGTSGDDVEEWIEAEMVRRLRAISL